jgi:hypothetical protein
MGLGLAYRCLIGSGGQVQVQSGRLGQMDRSVGQIGLGVRLQGLF